MSEMSMYEGQKKKMEGLCEEHDLVYKFRKDVYPVTFTISPLQGAGAQLSMLEDAEGDSYRSPDASMTWIFEDGVLSTKVSGGTFSISKTLRTKIENVLLKMITYWQQYFFRDIIERGVLKKALFPVIDETEAEGEELEPEEEEVDEAPASLSESTISEAIKLARAENVASCGMFQRRLKVGITESMQLINELEARGVIGPRTLGGLHEVLPFDVPEDEA